MPEPISRKLWCAQFARSLGVLSGLLFGLAPHLALAVKTVTLGWDPSTSPDVVGYQVYYGPVNLGLTNLVVVNGETTARISGLVEGVTYAFEVTAVDSIGRESLPSNQVTYTVPGAALTGVNFETNGTIKLLDLIGTGSAAQSWNLEGSTNMMDWKAVEEGVSLPLDESILVSANSSLMFRFQTETGEVPPTTMTPVKGFPNSFRFTSTNVLSEWSMLASSDLRNWRRLITKTNSSIHVSVIFSEAAMMVFRLRSQ